MNKHKATLIMLRINLYIFLVAILVFLSDSAKAQDVVFTQFNQSPLTLNPALTGVFDGEARVVGNYRNQWSSILGGDAYNAFSFSVDKRFAIGNGYLDVGLVGHTDRSGELNLGTKQVKTSLSYIIHLGKSENSSHYLSIGQDIGISQREMFGSGLEVQNFIDSDHLDLTTGLNWISQLKGRNRFNIGIAVHHVNKTKFEFPNDFQEVLSRRLSLHGGGEIELSEIISLTPMFLFNRQGDFNDLYFGLGLRKYFSEDLNSSYFEIGVLGGARSSRNNVSSTIVKVRHKQFMIGLSFDLTTSELAQAGSFDGGLELSLGYTFGRSALRSFPDIY